MQNLAIRLKEQFAICTDSFNPLMNFIFKGKVKLNGVVWVLDQIRVRFDAIGDVSVTENGTVKKRI